MVVISDYVFAIASNSTINKLVIIGVCCYNFKTIKRCNEYSIRVVDNHI